MNQESDLVKKSFYDSTEISEGELRDIIALAESMRQYDNSKSDLSLLPSYLKSPELTLSTALQVGEEMGLDSYIQKAIDSRYVPNEIQIADLTELEARPTEKGLIKIYQDEMLKALAEFPDISVGRDKDYIYNGFHIYRDTHFYRKTLFGKKVPKRSRGKLAVFNFNTLYKWVRIEVYDPIILRKCGEKIKKLRDISDLKQIIEYEYPVDIQ